MRVRKVHVLAAVVVVILFLWAIPSCEDYTAGANTQVFIQRAHV